MRRLTVECHDPGLKGFKFKKDEFALYILIYFSLLRRRKSDFLREPKKTSFGISVFFAAFSAY